MAQYRVMFVDDEDYIRSMLTAYFSDKFDMVAVDGGAEALGILERESYDLIVSDINMPGMNGPDFLMEVQKRYPGLRTALLTSSNIDEYVSFARENSVSSIIPKTVPFNFVEVEGIIMGLLTGEVFGLARYLQQDSGVIYGKFCIKSTSETRDVREKIATGIEEKFGSAGDMRLILDEVFMNAIYHAPGGLNGMEKYMQFSEVELEPTEYVYVEAGYDSEKYGVSVTDKRGALTREIVLGKMERQITGAGYMDDSGRGLHMCRLFADRLVVNIESGKRTEIIVMNYINANYRGYKPLYVNEV